MKLISVLSNFIVAVIFIIAFLFLTFQSSESVKKRCCIIIAGTIPETKINVEIGKSYKNSYKLYEKTTNLKPEGLLGWEIKFKLYDDEGNPHIAVSRYENIIASKEADLVVAPFGNLATYGVSQVTEKYKYPMVATASSNNIWTKGCKYLFQANVPNTRFFNPVIEIAQENKLKEIAIISAESEIFREISTGITKFAQEKGIKIVSFETYPYGTMDFSKTLVRLKSYHPDIVIGISPINESIAVTKQMAEFGLIPKIIGFSQAAAVDYYKILGGRAENVIAPSIWDIKFKTPGNENFVNLYSKEYGYPPDIHAAVAWMSCIILEKSFREKITEIGQKIKDEHRELIRASLSTLEFTGIMFGKYKVDENGLNIGFRTCAIQWQGAKKEIVWPTEIATSMLRLQHK